ncbi:outer membrane beta-barrel protein [Flammeovirga pacifica]|uniref:Outer membrane protein beta-barrel domain-containing protein n=1 Tax=Flammeovirga pacifica TaxID=915059 RepID=A0A1S1Z1U9_FLAPC|nr:outer membrane beta-barrel protein [Flammeovirga pacifica]OHX67248.1 hypothetical protein NH26_13295 [Flammeovirga pacifica]
MQKKEDKKDEFNEVWADAFKNEEINPPLDLWDDIEEEVDKINEKKNTFNIFRAAAAIITFGLLSSFLIKYDVPVASGYELGSISYSTARNIQEASMLPTDFFSSSFDDSKETIELFKEKYIAPSKKLIKEIENPFTVAKVNSRVIDKETKKVYYTELGSIEEDPKDFSDQILMARQSPSSIEKKVKKEKYLKVEVGAVQVDPNLKWNDHNIGQKTNTTSIALKGGIKMNENVFIELGAQFIQYSLNASLNDQNVAVNQKQISIPVAVGYKVNVSKKVNLDVFAGVAADFVFDQKVEGGTIEENTLVRNAVSNTSNISANVGASLNYKLAPKTSISVGTMYGSQLLDNSQHDEITSSNSALTLSMGLKYNII